MVTDAPPAQPVPLAPVDGGVVVPGRTERTVDLRHWIFPGVLALLVGWFALVTRLYDFYDATGLWGDDLTTLPNVRLVVVLGNLSAIVGVVLSRRATVLASALAAWPFLLVPLLGMFVWSWWLALLAIAVAAAYDGMRRAALPLLLTLLAAGMYCAFPVVALLPVGPVTAGSGDTWITFVLYTAASLAAVSISAAAGTGHRASVRAAAAALASQQALEVETVAVERARIAHDLHDVVAHHISLVAVRAESAPYVHPSMDAVSRDVLADIAEDARHALGELRQVLAVLQRTEGAERAPQPGAGDVAALVDAARSAGQSVTVVGDVAELPSAQGLVLYRAVQESLTNARRHAPGQPVMLTFATGAAPSGTDQLSELSRGIPRGTSDNESFVATVRISNPLVPRTSPAAPGRGLLGMRERVESIGGSLTAGEEDGEFVVELTLPVGGPEPTTTERTDAHQYGYAGDPAVVWLPDAVDGTDA